MKNSLISRMSPVLIHQNLWRVHADILNLVLLWDVYIDLKHRRVIEISNFLLNLTLRQNKLMKDYAGQKFKLFSYFIFISLSTSDAGIREVSITLYEQVFKFTSVVLYWLEMKLHGDCAAHEAAPVSLLIYRGPLMLTSSVLCYWLMNSNLINWLIYMRTFE
jgi:hypothetical protein